jgi:hypothetical protein
VLRDFDKPPKRRECVSFARPFVGGGWEPIYSGESLRSTYLASCGLLAFPPPGPERLQAIVILERLSAGNVPGDVVSRHPSVGVGQCHPSLPPHSGDLKLTLHNTCVVCKASSCFQAYHNLGQGAPPLTLSDCILCRTDDEASFPHKTTAAREHAVW